MKFLKDIKEDTLIICSNDNKKKILNEMDKLTGLLPVNFMDLNTLYDAFYFSYDRKAIYYLMNKYHLKYSVIVMYLNNLKYVNDFAYDNKKIAKLIDIKHEIDVNNLLIKDEYFMDYIKNKQIIFYGFNYLDKFTMKIIAKLKTITNITIINRKYQNYHHGVFCFNHINDEVEYVAISICSLIKKGVNINKIKLSNLDEEYIPIIKRIFKIYHIPINVEDNPSIYSTIIGKYFMDNYQTNLSNVIEKMKNKFNSDIVNQIINIVNKYSFEEDKLLVKDMITYDLLHTKVKKEKYENAVAIVDYQQDFFDDEYVFLLNFNQNSIPKVYKDENYLSNKEFDLLKLDNTYDLTMIEKDITIKSINSIKNLIITYKLESYQNNYFPSILINDMDMVIKYPSNELTHSNLANKIALCSSLDKYYKYNIKEDNLDVLMGNYNLKYKEYDNRFKGISFTSLNRILNNQLNLAYSSMQSYNECHFKYYINNLLKLDPYQENFSALIGNIFHHILEIGIKKDINVQKEVNDFIKDMNLSHKELFFINKLVSDINFSLMTIKEKLKFSKLKDIRTEEKFKVIKEKNITITFKGFIDKILSYKDNNVNYIVIIDYKTYDTDIKLDLLEYGLNIQLPIYLYLSNKNIANCIPIGFYVQKVLNTDHKLNLNKSLLERKKDNLKLVGYSNADEKIISLFDKDYASSSIIKGMKLKKDGTFASSSNVISNDEMNELIVKVDHQIDNTIDEILKGNFNINPKMYNNKNISCTYCKYKDLCFMTFKDLVYLKEEGDNND